MPKKKTRYAEKPWNPDPSKWAKLLEKPNNIAKSDTPAEPKGGWLLYRLDTLEDAKQE